MVVVVARVPVGVGVIGVVVAVVSVIVVVVVGPWGRMASLAQSGST